jgi:hypothetical protein
MSVVVCAGVARELMTPSSDRSVLPVCCAGYASVLLQLSHPAEFCAHNELRTGPAVRVYSTAACAA